MAVNELIKRSIEKPGLYWFVSPTYGQSKNIAWLVLKRMLAVDELWKFNEVELRADHPLGARIELKGADREDTLRGVGVNGIVLDECATMKPNVWPEVLRPMLQDTKGWAFFIGTPKGRNWFYDIFRNTYKAAGWQSWQYPTSVNKYISEDEIDLARKDMSETSFQQEIEARFLEDSSGVFRRVRNCVVGEYKEPEKGERYVIGVDLAKHEDWTVLTVMDTTSRHVVSWERFNEISWPEQKERIQRLHERYNYAEVILDATGLGDPIFDDLQDANVSATPFKFTQESKRQLIENLQIAIERRLVTFPKNPILQEELERYGYILTQNGRAKYGAPEGYHDDAVTSFALAVWGLRGEFSAARLIQKRMEADPIDRQGRGTIERENENKVEYEFAGY